MHLKSLTLKGFKSFPNRTRLEFAPGIAVIIGPNGSGKSNITDAVLWALGEQSPLAIRGQTMQDVIFAGGHGVPSRNEAEVEVVIDNSDGAFNSTFSEIAITRFLNKDGESGYRLNGARCRLIDVVEYVIVREDGPPHDRSFESVAQVDGEEIGRGAGKSKKSAEQSAALAALKAMDED